jgi:hypothetical protein
MSPSDNTAPRQSNAIYAHPRKFNYVDENKLFASRYKTNTCSTLRVTSDKTNNITSAES